MLNSAGQMSDAIRDGNIRQRSQPVLNMAVEHGTARKLNGMPVWDRSGAVDVAPIIAATMAHYALLTTDPPDPEDSAYEDHDLLVV